MLFYVRKSKWIIKESGLFHLIYANISPDLKSPFGENSIICQSNSNHVLIEISLNYPIIEKSEMTNQKLKSVVH